MLATEQYLVPYNKRHLLIVSYFYVAPRTGIDTTYCSEYFTSIINFFFALSNFRTNIPVLHVVHILLCFHSLRVIFGIIAGSIHGNFAG